MQKFKPHEFYMIQGARLCAHRGPCEQRVQTTGSRGEVDVYSTGLHHQWLSNHEQSPRSTSAPFTEIIYRSAHRRDTIFRVTVHRARMQCDVPTGIKEYIYFFFNSSLCGWIFKVMGPPSRRGRRRRRLRIFPHHLDEINGHVFIEKVIWIFASNISVQCKN